MKYKIIVDSSSDLTNDYLKDEAIDFEVVPLTIHVDKNEFVDDENIDIPLMLETMKNFNGKSTSSCPSPGDYVKSITADYNFCITISSKLSGSNNSANLAKNICEDKNVFVIDSKGTAGMMELIVDELVRLIKEGNSYDEICSKILKFRDNLNLFFVLESFDNLVKNGRMSKFSALFAKLIKIRPLCIASDGDIKMHKTVRTRWAALDAMIDEIANSNIDFNNRVCIISHTFAEDDALKIKEKLLARCPFKEVRIRPTRGLCSFYALTKGIICSY
ncbi:TPA: DegV family protein [Candidatus Avacholeplasma faecigallinarum]|nr:DegV family protein [Candidatus Avacholeplasma faecigallinarum]